MLLDACRADSPIQSDLPSPQCHGLGVPHNQWRPDNFSTSFLTGVEYGILGVNAALIRRGVSPGQLPEYTEGIPGDALGEQYSFVSPLKLAFRPLGESDGNIPVTFWFYLISLPSPWLVQRPSSHGLPAFDQKNAATVFPKHWGSR
jgi:hypothetical protein